MDQSGNRVEGLIRNEDWESNPVSFDFKQSESSEKQTLNINSIQEFCIYEISKYRKFKVFIDRSSDMTSELDYQRNPVYSEETLFLKVLVEGKANLYEFEDRGLTRFFFDTDSTVIQQLVYKSYLNAQQQISTNSLFKQQILENLKCNAISFSDIQQIDYKKNELIACFITYNKWRNVEAVLYHGNKNRDKFNFSVKAGVQFSSLYVQNDMQYYDHITFDNKINFRAALELEYVLPFNNNKVALYIQPAFQQCKSSGTTVHVTSHFDEIVDGIVDFQSIELPIGVRYYFFLNNKSKIYLNADIIFDFNFGEGIRIHKSQTPMSYYDSVVKSNTNFSAGIGYKYQKFLVELNWQTSQNLMKTVPSWVCEYRTWSISLGYSIF